MGKLLMIPAADIVDQLTTALAALKFGPPIAFVYNPLEYAHRGYQAYLQRYAKPPKEIVLLGMNPGPWGMAQTGVPFGDVDSVRYWLGIETAIDCPELVHPLRPIDGFDCPRREISRQRLWGWAKQRFGTAPEFFKHFFVANYCPLLFIESSGLNRTPDKLRAAEKESLFGACDRALRQTIELMRPRYVIGIGRFAEARAQAALTHLKVKIGRVTHPSSANPKANRGWASLMETELARIGIPWQSLS
jgi:single-strand selective monofunctional uracil DNA glycosylase